MNLNRILIFSYDAGGANLAMAYAFFMNKKGHEVKCFPKGPAVKIFFNHVPKLICEEEIEFNQNDIIVTGSSGIHSDYEMKIIKENKSKVFKTICLLDSTANLRIRFSIGSKLLEKEELPHEVWYDNLEDDFSEYLDIENILVKHENFYLKYLKEEFYVNRIKTENKDILKYKGKYLLVLTEYISELYGNEFGFDEFDFLKEIFSSIEKKELIIFLKTHPAENNDKYDDILKEYKYLNILKGEYNIQEVLYNCKVVFGLNSSVFKESILLNKPTFSVQIGAKKSLDTIKEINVISSTDELKKVLDNYFKG